MSRRAVLERERAQKAEQFWADIQEGQTRKGIVKSIKPFGAFVDLGGADGLIPVSEFSWQRVNDLNEFVKLGQEVQVMVARLDREARKIGLSLKQLTTSPWDDFATRVKVGARQNGKVTRTTDFGAFVELEPGIEGLIHISELSTQRIRRVRDIVGEGQTVEVEILSVDPAARRIGLSLKSIAKEKEAATDAAEEAERLADIKAAEEVMASRPVNPNLRGGIGSNLNSSSIRNRDDSVSRTECQDFLMEMSNRELPVIWCQRITGVWLVERQHSLLSSLQNASNAT